MMAFKVKYHIGRPLQPVRSMKTLFCMHNLRHVGATVAIRTFHATKRSKNPRNTDNLEDVIEKIENMNYDEASEYLDSLGVPEYEARPSNIIMKERNRFKDKLIVRLKAGNGGNGAATFEREKFKAIGPPSGGSGGKGGDVVLVADQTVDNLCTLLHAYNGENGQSGMKRQRDGHNGASATVKVPIGTLVHEWFPDTRKMGKALVDLGNQGDTFIAAKGGKGGKGNMHFVSGSNRSPQNAESGQPGEEKHYMLELKCIAEVGLVGFPNAGKSTLLAALSNARPKIAAYAFTTLFPTIGVLDLQDYNDPISVADLPGIIEGAHMNKGLGFEFLRHIERTKILCYVIDMSQTVSDPVKEYMVLRHELKMYNPQLLERRSIIVANKMDNPEFEGNLDRFMENISLDHDITVIPISAKSRKNLDVVKDELKKLTLEYRKEELQLKTG